MTLSSLIERTTEMIVTGRRARSTRLAFLGLVAFALLTSCGGSREVTGQPSVEPGSAATTTEPFEIVAFRDHPTAPKPLPEHLVLPVLSGAALAVDTVPTDEPEVGIISERAKPVEFGNIRVYSPGRYVDADGDYVVQLLLFHGVDESAAVVGVGDRFSYAGTIFELVKAPANGYFTELHLWPPGAGTSAASPAASLATDVVGDG